MRFSSTPPFLLHLLPDVSPNPGHRALPRMAAPACKALGATGWQSSGTRDRVLGLERKPRCP